MLQFLLDLLSASQLVRRRVESIIRQLSVLRLIVRNKAHIRVTANQRVQRKCPSCKLNHFCLEFDSISIRLEQIKFIIVNYHRHCR